MKEKKQGNEQIGLSAAIGLELRRARDNSGFSLTQMAKHLGMSKGNLSRLENGHVKITVETALAYAAALGFTELSLKTGLVDESGKLVEG